MQLNRGRYIADIIQKILTTTSERQGRVLIRMQVHRWNVRNKRGTLVSHQSDLIESDILAYLKSQGIKSHCVYYFGSVDDGKSTLIGRLYESKLIYEDQLAALESDSKWNARRPN